MTKNILHYNYQVTVREIYDLTKKEAFTLILNEQICAKAKNHAIILTSKKTEEESSFEAYSSEKLSHNFTWIHVSPQEILNFDEETPQEDKYYVMVYESIESE